jgi:hypothetical protein
LVLAAIAVLALWHLRRDTLDSQTRELGLLSLALTDEIDRGLRGTQEGLQALRAELRGGHLPLAGAAAAQTLQARASLMPLVQMLWLVDSKGHVVTASGTTQTPPAPTFAPALDGLSAEAMSLSQPFPNTANATGHGTLVALAIPLQGLRDTPNLSGGWILAAVPAGALLGAFNAALPAADARMAVFRNDGVRLASANFSAPAPGEAAAVQRLAERPFVAVRHFHSGSDNLVGLHSVPRYGFKVLVSRDLANLLAFVAGRGRADWGRAAAPVGQHGRGGALRAARQRAPYRSAAGPANPALAGQQAGVAGHAGGQLPGALSGRPGRRHHAGRDGAPVRALLHHAQCPVRHRAGPGGGARRDGRVRRGHRRAKRPGAGGPLHAVFSGAHRQRRRGPRARAGAARRAAAPGSGCWWWWTTSPNW